MTNKNMGRKPLPESERRKSITLTFAPDVYEFLQAQTNASRAVEAMVRRSSAFKAWKKERK